jgi:hypothetical protein
MPKCDEMKKGQVYVCEDCGLEVEVVKECEDCGPGTGKECGYEECEFKCHNKPLTLKA